MILWRPVISLASVVRQMAAKYHFQCEQRDRSIPQIGLGTATGTQYTVRRDKPGSLTFCVLSPVAGTGDEGSNGRASKDRWTARRAADWRAARLSARHLRVGDVLGWLDLRASIGQTTKDACRSRALHIDSRQSFTE